MGEPATPSQAERAETLALCRAIVRAVREDMAMPDEVYSRTCMRVDIEAFALQLAQEVTLLAEQLAEVTTERDAWRGQHDFVTTREKQIVENLAAADRELKHLRALFDEVKHQRDCYMRAAETSNEEF